MPKSKTLDELIRYYELDTTNAERLRGLVNAEPEYGLILTAHLINHNYATHHMGQASVWGLLNGGELAEATACALDIHQAYAESCDWWDTFTFPYESRAVSDVATRKRGRHA